ncbi:MAG: dihydropteroate synthase [Nitrospirota bacterium]
MIVIAENLNSRNASYMKAVKNRDKNEIIRMSKALSDAGADIINIQCSLDGSGDEKAIPFVADNVQRAADCALSLDTRNVEALKTALPLCKKVPLINFISADENEQTDKIIELAADFKANLVVRASRGIIPTSLEAKMQILYDLIESANAADIPNERLFADPSIVHLGRGMGQSHLVNSHRCVKVLKEIIEPPVKTIAWISNVSTGISRKLKPLVNSIFLTYLSGADLDAAMIDVLAPENRKVVYLIKSFRDRIVFSPADLA